MLTSEQKKQILLAQYYKIFGNKTAFEYFLKKYEKEESFEQRKQNLHKRYANAFNIDLTELHEFLDVHYQAFQMANMARCAGFGGWKKHVPSDEDAFQKYRDALSKQEQITLDEMCAQGFIKFVQWYQHKHVQGEQTSCCYCGISEELCRELIPQRAIRGGKRAQHLEIERLNTEENIYADTNCALACYVCNNAKSNIFTVQEFKPIAYEINKWWNEKLKNSNLKDKYPKIEFPTAIWTK